MAAELEGGLLSKSGLTAPAATALAAVMTLVGGLVGALINGYFNNKTNIELEQIKFETNLILQAINTGDQPSAVKTLKFFANAGLISHYEKRISTLVLKENDLEVPAIGSAGQQVAAASINSFAYQTSPAEVEPGRRDWRRVDPSHWTETYPNGKASRFIEKTRINLHGCAGKVVANEEEPNFQVFIPDRGCSSMSLWFRRGEQQDWVQFATMIDVT
jgi:hypothetical protein